MGSRREYDIAFVGLKPGTHVFEYSIDDKFFVEYGNQDFTNCEAVVKLNFEKKNGFMQLKFDIGGRVAVLCDRCGNSLEKQLWDEFNLIVKVVDEPVLMNEKELDPDVHYIGRSESHLQVGDWIYEFINLCLPLQTGCSENEIGGPLCNKEVLEKLKQMELESTKDSNVVWKGLEKFKNIE